MTRGGTCPNLTCSPFGVHVLYILCMCIAVYKAVLLECKPGKSELCCVLSTHENVYNGIVAPLGDASAINSSKCRFLLSYQNFRIWNRSTSMRTACADGIISWFTNLCLLLLPSALVLHSIAHTRLLHGIGNSALESALIFRHTYIVMCIIHTQHTHTHIFLTNNHVAHSSLLPLNRGSGWIGEASFSQNKIAQPLWCSSVGGTFLRIITDEY